MAVSAKMVNLKREVEASLAPRIPSALSPIAAQSPRLTSCGIAVIDDLLGGGLPLGAITEFSGLPSSGRTSLAASVLAEATAEAACAYIDADDTADPRCLAGAGVCLQNLLWIRLTNLVVPGREGPAESVAGSVAKSVSVPGLDPRAFAGQRYGGHHPRTESKGMHAALGEMLKQKAEAKSLKHEGTPGYPNQKLSLKEASGEQIRWEQFNSRKVDENDPIRRANHAAAAAARQRTLPAATVPSTISGGAKPWTRLDQAIRAADQVLHSGGFRVVVLDLGSTIPAQALRIPAATWFRFRRAAQTSDTVFLLLTQAPCARSSASCVLDCSAERGAVHGNVLGRLAYSAEVARQRASPALGKKAPGRSAGWEMAPLWMRAGGR